MAAPILSHFENPITVSIHGVVFDEFGDALPGISVVISQGRVVIESNRSSRAGEFTFNNVKLKEGIHSVSAQTPGFEPASEEVVVKLQMEGAVVNLALRLESRLENLSPDQLVKADPAEQRAIANKDRFVRMRVFFATDRNKGFVYRRDFRKAFTDTRNSDGELRFGQCELSIPERHQIGQLETPSLFRLEFRQNPSKHVVLLDLQKLGRDSFFAVFQPLLNHPIVAKRLFLSTDIA